MASQVKQIPATVKMAFQQNLLNILTLVNEVEDRLLLTEKNMERYLQVLNNFASLALIQWLLTHVPLC